MMKNIFFIVSSITTVNNVPGNDVAGRLRNTLCYRMYLELSESSCRSIGALTPR